MLINVINRNAAKLLLQEVEQSNRGAGSWGAMYFACANANIRPDEADLLAAIHPVLSERDASLYLFDDGDIVVVFHGVKRSVIEALEQALYTHFNLPLPGIVFFNA